MCRRGLLALYFESGNLPEWRFPRWAQDSSKRKNLQRQNTGIIRNLNRRITLTHLNSQALSQFGTSAAHIGAIDIRCTLRNHAGSCCPALRLGRCYGCGYPDTLIISQKYYNSWQGSNINRTVLPHLHRDFVLVRESGRPPKIGLRSRFQGSSALASGQVRIH